MQGPGPQNSRLVCVVPLRLVVALLLLLKFSSELIYSQSKFGQDNDLTRNTGGPLKKKLKQAHRFLQSTYFYRSHPPDEYWGTSKLQRT